MPVTIRELVIRTNISEQASGESSAPENMAKLKEQIIQECLNQLHDKVGDKFER